MKLKKPLFWLPLLFLGLVVFTIDNGHEWGDDFALYISQARSILNQNSGALLLNNQWMMKNSEGLIGPELYPWGYPVFLSGLIGLFGELTIESKIVQWAFLSSVALFSACRILKRFQFEKISGVHFFLLGLMVFHPKILLFANRFNNDLFFLVGVYLFWAILFWVRAQKNLHNPFLYEMILGLLIVVLSQTRDVGLFLLFPFLLNSVSKWRQFHSKSPMITGVVFSCFTLLFYAVGKMGSGNIHLSELDFSLIPGLMVTYLKLFGQYPFVMLKQVNHTLSAWFGLGIGCLVLLIFLRRARTIFKSYWLELSWIIPNILLLLIWPSVQGERFLFPWIWLVFIILFDHVSRYQLPVLLSKVLVPLLTLALWLQIGSSIIYHIKIDSDEISNESTTDMFDYLQTCTSEDVVVYFKKPRLMYLKTHRRSLFCTLPDREPSVIEKCNYLVENRKPIQGYLPNFVDDHKGVLVFENDDYRIYKRNLKAQP